MVDLSRLESLIGKDKLKQLKTKRVLICGVGGVGSFVAESLARSGIGKLTIVDYDNIDSSNLNRQLMTNKDNIGKCKVEVLKKHLEEISDCEVKAVNTFIDENFKLDKQYDYVVDCIDSLKSKNKEIINKHNKNLPLDNSKLSLNEGISGNVKKKGSKKVIIQKLNGIELLACVDICISIFFKIFFLR